MNAVAAQQPAMQLRYSFTVSNVRAFDMEHAKQVARQFAGGVLIGLQLQAYAKHESNGTYTVEFR